jgi:hypothetical protein
MREVKREKKARDPDQLEPSGCNGPKMNSPQRITTNAQSMDLSAPSIA